MTKSKRTSNEERVAKISGKYLIIVALVTVIGGGLFAILTRSNKEEKTTPIQNVKNQKLDTGSINNYSNNSKADVRNNTVIGNSNNVVNGDKITTNK